jgi:hypothetical protein
MEDRSEEVFHSRHTRHHLALIQTFVDQSRLPYESLAVNGRARFMLRMRLSPDCGYTAVATKGVSDNLFTVESPAALTRGRSR